MKQGVRLVMPEKKGTKEPSLTAKVSASLNKVYLCLITHMTQQISYAKAHKKAVMLDMYISSIAFTIIIQKHQEE